MEQIVGFFTANERWVYGTLGVFAIWQIFKFSSAWNTLRSAAFSMERELAQNKLNRAAIMLVLALLVAVSEFTLVSFVAPTMPGALPLPSPTLNILAIPTATLAPAQTGETPLVEVTPTSIRLRKIMLKEIDRKRAARQAQSVAANAGAAKLAALLWSESNENTARASLRQALVQAPFSEGKTRDRALGGEGRERGVCRLRDGVPPGQISRPVLYKCVPVRVERGSVDQGAHGRFIPHETCEGKNFPLRQPS